MSVYFSYMLSSLHQLRANALLRGIITLERPWPSFIFVYLCVSPQPPPIWMKDVGQGIQVCPPSHCVSFVIRHCVQSFPRTLLRKSRHQELTNVGHTHQEIESSICGQILRNVPKLVESHTLSIILLWLLLKREAGRLLSL